jgi:hypothetical protein
MPQYLETIINRLWTDLLLAEVDRQKEVLESSEGKEGGQSEGNEAQGVDAFLAGLFSAAFLYTGLSGAYEEVRKQFLKEPFVRASRFAQGFLRFQPVSLEHDSSPEKLAGSRENA